MVNSVKFRDGSIHYPVFCVDCQHFPHGLRYESNWNRDKQKADCEFTEILTYVTGEKGHLRCSDKNHDGMCIDFILFDGSGSTGR